MQNTRQSSSQTRQSVAAVSSLAALLSLLCGCAFCARPAAAQVPAPLLTAQAQDAANGPYPGYYTWPEVQAKIAGWQQQYPNLVQVQSLGKTLEGRDIPVLRVTAAATGADTPEVMLLSGIHPREQQPIIGVVDLLDELLSGYGKDPRLTKILRERVLYIVPIFNVDGKVYDLAHGNGTTRGADWRKNRRPNPDGTFGVDLNRNFGARWGGARAYDPSWRGSTAETHTDIYEGPAPLSEPEDQALAAFVAAHRDHLRAFLDLHSPLHEINLPEYVIGPDCDRYAAVLAAMHAGQAKPYPVNGLVRDAEPPAPPRGGDSGVTYTWIYYTQGVYALNLEFAPPRIARTGVRARYAPPAEIETEYRSNIRGALLGFFEAAGALPGSHRGNVSCAAGNGQFSAPLVPGATVAWTPPALTGPWSYAVLVSEGAKVVAASEYRRAPLDRGFTLQADASAKPGTVVPATLYVWDDHRGESIMHFNFTVAAPAAATAAKNRPASHRPAKVGASGGRRSNGGAQRTPRSA